MLDVKSRYTKKYSTTEGSRFKQIAGRQMVDGLPFEISGEVYFFGQAAVDRRLEGKFPKELREIPVGRKFEELHLVHFTHWWDAEGRTVAQVALSYEDGSSHRWPLCYGVHLRDGSRLLTEEKELLTHEGSKVFWRGDGNKKLKATDRLFKSMLLNPHPEKKVRSIDFSAGSDCLASYGLMAATVANRDDKRKVDPPVPLDEPEREFVGRIVVRVFDATTNNPIEGALVQTSEKIDDVWLVAPVALTDAKGEMILKYPPGRTAWIAISPTKKGYEDGNVFWENDLDFPTEHVFFLHRE